MSQRGTSRRAVNKHWAPEATCPAGRLAGATEVPAAAGMKSCARLSAEGNAAPTFFLQPLKSASGAQPGCFGSHEVLALSASSYFMRHCTSCGYSACTQRWWLISAEYLGTNVAQLLFLYFISGVAGVGGFYNLERWLEKV